MRHAARALACAVLLVLAGCRSAPKGPELDDAAFQRELLSLDAVGPAAREARALNGHVVLVSFFATWCFPCVAELPTLQALQRDYGPQGFRVVGVGMDLEGWKVLEPFAQQMELNYPVLVASDRIRDGQSVFGPIRALPTTYVLDRQGRVLGAWQGMAPHEALDKAIQKALKK